MLIFLLFSTFSEFPTLKIVSFNTKMGRTNSTDTTVAFSTNTYDRMQMTPSMESDYTKGWGVVVFATEYQISVCEGTAKNAGTEAALSDHYPVWAEYYVDQDED